MSIHLSRMKFHIKILFFFSSTVFLIDDSFHQIVEYQRLGSVYSTHDVKCLDASVGEHPRPLVCVFINATIATVLQYHPKDEEFVAVQYIYGRGMMSVHIVQISTGKGETVLRLF